MMCHRGLCAAHLLVSARQVLLVVGDGSGGSHKALIMVMMMVMSVGVKLHGL